MVVYGRRGRARRTFPIRLGLVEEVYHFEGLGVFLGQCVEILTQKDVFFRDVRKEQLELGGVEGGGESVGDDLVERGAVMACEMVA
jgi:hypothetical protein